MRAWFVVALALSACHPDPGLCDLGAAGEIVYDTNGNPAFAGQAVIIQSCGGGGFCHADTLAGVDSSDVEAVSAAHAARMGAPRGLSFDLRLASTNDDENREATQRLGRDQHRISSMRGEILDQVQSGRMPPGDVGAMVGGFRIYDRVDDDGVTFSPLPRLAGTADGGSDPITPEEVADARDIVRNWLACGSPVVERTVEQELAETVGFVVERCERACVDLRWAAEDPTAPDRALTIYDDIIRPTCTLSDCHDSIEPTGDLDWETGGAMAVHARVADVQSRGRLCAIGATRFSIIDTMNADASLMLMKLEAISAADICGSPMPQVGDHLSDQRLCVIRQWITCGACPEPDGGACAACLDAARATCGVDLDQPGDCAGGAPAPCDNRVEL